GAAPPFRTPDQREELLGALEAAHRPEACAGAAGHDHRVPHGANVGKEPNSKGPKGQIRKRTIPAPALPPLALWPFAIWPLLPGPGQLPFHVGPRRGFHFLSEVARGEDVVAGEHALE